MFQETWDSCQMCVQRTVQMYWQVLERCHYILQQVSHSLQQIYSNLQYGRPFRLRDVPAEIVHRICGYLDKYDLRNFRCVAQRYAAIGDEHMFPQGHLRFRMHPDLFRRLPNVTGNPMIRQRIKTLELVGDDFEFGKVMNRISRWSDE